MAKFIIPTDWHYSISLSRIVLFLFSNKMSGTFSLDDNCLYSAEDWSDKDRTSLNKVVGFCNGVSEDDCARIAQRCVRGRFFEITTYIHDGGEFEAGSEIVLATICPKQDVVWSLERIPGGWIYIIDGKKSFVGVKKVGLAKSWIPRVKLWPYFGGVKTLDHDQTLNLTT